MTSYLNRVAPYIGVLIFLAVLISFDFIQIPSTYHQFRTRYYSHVQGQIFRSRIDGPHGKGGSYKADLAYNYAVNKHFYTGTKWRFAEGFALSRDAATAIVTAHPVGAPVDVYFDPDAPEISLLSPGLRPVDFLFLLVLLPLNLLLGLAFLVIPLIWLYRCTVKSLELGVPISQVPPRAILRPPYLAPLCVSLGVAAIASMFFLCVIQVFAGEDPSALTVSIAWGLVLLVAVLVGVSGDNTPKQRKPSPDTRLSR